MYGMRAAEWPVSGHPMSRRYDDRMTTLIAIMTGGALGALLRYGVMVACTRTLGDAFPYGTLAVNLIGCFLIGFLGIMLLGPWKLSEAARLGLVIGVLGGFTTFSSYGWDLLALIEQRHLARAFLYLTLSNGLGVLGVWAGMGMARVWTTGGAAAGAG